MKTCYKSKHLKPLNIVTNKIILFHVIDWVVTIAENRIKRRSILENLYKSIISQCIIRFLHCFNGEKLYKRKKYAPLSSILLSCSNQLNISAILQFLINADDDADVRKLLEYLWPRITNWKFSFKKDEYILLLNFNNQLKKIEYLIYQFLFRVLSKKRCVLKVN